MTYILRKYIRSRRMFRLALFSYAIVVFARAWGWNGQEAEASIVDTAHDVFNAALENPYKWNHVAGSACYSQGSYYSQASYYSQGTYYSQGSYQTTITKNVAESGNVSVGGTISKATGTFVIDHPLDPKNKLLFHSFVESPDAKNFYDGVAVVAKNGEARVRLPSYFMALNTEFRYQLRPIGTPQPDLHIKEGIDDNQFVIAGGTPGAKVSWQVTGVRKDPYIIANPIKVEVEKGPKELVDVGEYLHEGLYPASLLSGPLDIFGWLRSRLGL